ncbi:TonB-dependent hemoglobin/transferrin/lactoferrin family receptor [Pseudomonas sp. NCCP-436]|uniref:TonB-dependent hemoglobin/transferrin/lactoferrin family receptor n=1 Tax=Pseudomonas sp. NCCP-436 TaxID=2842481 RepID=UPI001C7E4B90|nr:TonB-dependent hemoglobin/transferrin/lactoferrin family receptor [Pseudomonas sp. NCCP-436]GIZ12243.1 outer membrane heme receptor [Pseudomonas sp. NCCP-436]
MPACPPFARRPWLALLLLCPSLALAATTTELPYVEVTATTDPEAKPGTTSTTAETLERRQIRSFDDLSRRAEPGVNFNRNNNSINIRGLDRDRVLTTLDGIRLPWLNDVVRDVNGGLDSIGFESLSSIDVVRGANSSQFGSGALGGALQLHTLSPDDLLGEQDDFAGLIKSDYDSADHSRGLNAALAGRINDTSWLLQAGGRRGHELENRGNNGVLGTERTKSNPADSDQQNLLFKLQQKLSDEHRLGLTAEWFERVEDFDSRINQGTANYPNHYDTRETNERRRFSVDHQYRAADNNSLLDWADTIVYWQKLYREDQVKATRAGTLAGPFGRQNEIEKSQYGITSALGKQLGQHNLSLGVEWSRVVAEQYSGGYDACPSNLVPPFPPRPDSTPAGIYYSCINLHTNQAEMPKTPGTLYGLYLKDEISLTDNLTLTPGIRYDRYEYRPESGTSDYVLAGDSVMITDNKDSSWSGSLLLSWQASELATFYAQWAQGFRAPDVNELYSTFINSGMGYARVGNPNLKPEKSTGYEVGARLGDERAGGSISLFDNHYRNFIDSITANEEDYGFQPGEFPTFFEIMENRSKVRIYGAEGTAHWQFAPDWKAWSSIAWAVGKDRETNQHLNSVAPLTATLGLSYTRQNHGADLTLTSARRRDKVENDDDFKAPGYGVIDLTGYWQPAALEGVRLQAGLFNLFDKKYWNAINVPGSSNGRTTPQPVDYYSEPGRSFRVSASWQF